MSCDGSESARSTTPENLTAFDPILTQERNLFTAASAWSGRPFGRVSGLIFADTVGAMKLQKCLPRRRFLQISAVAPVSGNALLSCSHAGRFWRFLTSEEAVLVEAISEQVIPTDEYPKGKEAGVVNFIDRQLAGPYKRFRKIYQEGLAGVNQTSTLLIPKALR